MACSRRSRGTWTKGTNIKWKVPMPSYTNASPVIVGDKVFTTVEPHWLYCLDKNTGEVLWKQASSYVDFMEEADKADAEAALKAWAKSSSATRRSTRTSKWKKERQELERKIAAERQKNADADLEARGAVEGPGREDRCQGRRLQAGNPFSGSTA